MAKLKRDNFLGVWKPPFFEHFKRCNYCRETATLRQKAIACIFPLKCTSTAKPHLFRIFQRKSKKEATEKMTKKFKSSLFCCTCTHSSESCPKTQKGSHVKSSTSIFSHRRNVSPSSFFVKKSCLDFFFLFFFQDWVQKKGKEKKSLSFISQKWTLLELKWNLYRYVYPFHCTSIC